MKNTNENISKKINKTAEKYILSYGISGWNMDDFADEVGITKRTLYKYVESKESLVKNVLVDYIQNIQEQLQAIFQNSIDFHTGMKKIIEVYPSMVVQMDSKIIQKVFLQYPSIEEVVQSERLKLTKNISAYIQKAQNIGEINSAYSSDDILEIIQSLILSYAKKDPTHLEEKLRTCISMLYYGLHNHMEDTL